MSREWPKFSFTEMLKPPDGWRTDHAILATYSADLVVIVTALLALSGCDVESTGGRVELVRAIEALRGRVRILAQAGRVANPSKRVPILKLLDKFLSTVKADEAESSFHPKAALLRFQRTDAPDDFQWRVWLGSRNLTRAMNWEAGLVLVSRADKKGDKIEGLTTVGKELAGLAKLPGLAPKAVADELSTLTWDCPPGCSVTKVSLLGPGRAPAMPVPETGADKIFVVSPFLDAETVRKTAQWGGPKARRTLVSTIPEIQRLWQEDRNIFAGFENLCQQPMPELPAEGAVDAEKENSAAVEVAESEEAPPHGLHAKLVLATKGKRRQLWIGSANATARGWQGRNTEVLAEAAVNDEVAEGLESFISGSCERYTPVETAAITDEVEEALEKARKALSARWPLTQDATGDVLQIIAEKPLPVLELGATVDVASLGGPWTPWPPDAMRVSAGRLGDWERSDFVQIRATLGDRVCAWLQVAPCTPPPDEKRDHGLIAHYLDPHTFLLWLRSLLSDSPVENAGGDWDLDREGALRPNGSAQIDTAGMPTVEEILKSWARDAEAFRSADKKVKTYLAELERRAAESGALADAELLRAFGKTWHKIAGELQ